jgi:hypothetical protein
MIFLISGLVACVIVFAVGMNQYKKVEPDNIKGKRRIIVAGTIGFVILVPILTIVTVIIGLSTGFVGM